MSHIVVNIDPVLISLGSLKIHWYGLLFAVGAFSGLNIMKRIFLFEKRPLEPLDPMFGYVLVGVIVGARLGHCLFYEPEYYLNHPLEIFMLWKGGLASHIGGAGAIVALIIFSRIYKESIIYLLDRVAISTALFGMCVRLGNFFNAEILGVPTEVPWGVVFSRVDELPRHPAQLYESFAYLVTFLLLLFAYQKKAVREAKGFLFGLFLMLIFTARVAIEFVKVRQADYAAEYFFSVGQWLSVPYLLAGVGFLLFAVFNMKTQNHKS